MTEDSSAPRDKEPENVSLPSLIETEEGADGSSMYKYRDFSNVNDEELEQTTAPPSPPPPGAGNSRNGAGGSGASVESSIRVQKFPVKLYAILAQKEFQDIISWMPHGRSWKVLKPNLFESLVMPLFFEYSNYHSFNRLVNAWSFRRISSGPDRGSYYHELFLRGKPHLQKFMRRLPKTHKKLPMKKGDEPDFYGMDKASPLPTLEEVPLPSSAMLPQMRQAQQQQQQHAALGSAGMGAAGLGMQSQCMLPPTAAGMMGGMGGAGGGAGGANGMSAFMDFESRDPLMAGLAGAQSARAAAGMGMQGIGAGGMGMQGMGGLGGMGGASSMGNHGMGGMGGMGGHSTMNGMGGMNGMGSAMNGMGSAMNGMGGMNGMGSAMNGMGGMNGLGMGGHHHLGGMNQMNSMNGINSLRDSSQFGAGAGGSMGVVGTNGGAGGMGGGNELDQFQRLRQIQQMQLFERQMAGGPQMPGLANNADSLARMQAENAMNLRLSRQPC